LNFAKENESQTDSRIEKITIAIPPTSGAILFRTLLSFLQELQQFALNYSSTQPTPALNYSSNQPTPFAIMYPFTNKRMGTISYDHKPKPVQWLERRPQVISACNQTDTGVEMQPHLLPYPDYVAYKASVEEPIPEEEQQRFEPRPAVAAIVANPAQGILAAPAILALPANPLGGINVCMKRAPTWLTYYEAGTAETNARLQVLKGAIDEHNLVSKTNTDLKKSIINIVDPTFVQRLSNILPQPNVKNIGMMSAKELITECDREFQPTTHLEIQACKAFVLTRFDNDDLINAAALVTAINLRQTMIAMLPDFAKPTFPGNNLEFKAMFTSTAALNLVYSEFQRNYPNLLDQTLPGMINIVNRYYDSALAQHGGTGLAASEKKPATGSQDKRGGKGSSRPDLQPMACMYHLLGQACPHPANCSTRYTHGTETFAIGRGMVNMLKPKENKNERGKEGKDDKQDRSKQQTTKPADRNNRDRNRNTTRGRSNSVTKEEANDVEDEEDTMSAVTCTDNN